LTAKGLHRLQQTKLGFLNAACIYFDCSFGTGRLPLFGGVVGAKSAPCIPVPPCTGEPLPEPYRQRINRGSSDTRYGWWRSTLLTSHREDITRDTSN